MKHVKTILLILFCILSFYHGKAIITTSKQTLKLWFEVLIPSMFVTMTLLKLLYEQHMILPFHFHILPKLFHCDFNTCIFILYLFLLGFPTGAVFIQDAFQQKQINQQQAKRLLYCCSFASPSFTILTCGQHLYHNTKTGIILYLSQIISGLCLFMIIRKPYVSINIQPTQSNSFSSILLNTGKTLYLMGGIIMMVSCIPVLYPSILPNSLQKILQILLECSSGCMIISQQSISLFYKQLLTCMLLAFAGVCVHLQVFNASTSIKASYFIFLVCRIIQAFFAAIVFLICSICM